MKKILVMVVTALMVTMSVQAQDEWKNEVGVAYGIGSNTDIVGSFYKGMFTGKQLDYWGPVSLEYFHRVSSNNKWGIGGIVTIGGCKWDEQSDAKTTFYSVLPAVKYNWSYKKNLSWYSKIAIGATLAHDSGFKSVNAKDDNSVIFNWHVSFIGVEFGSAFRGFVELGTGEQGVILGGLRYKF